MPLITPSFRFNLKISLSVEKEELHSLMAFLDRSRIRKESLEELAEHETGLTPTKVAKRIDASRPNVSKQLIELEDKELVEVINPEANYNRYYDITDKGRELLKHYSEE